MLNDGAYKIIQRLEVNEDLSWFTSRLQLNFQKFGTAKVIATIVYKALMCLKDGDGIANSVSLDQTDSLLLVIRPFFSNTKNFLDLSHILQPPLETSLN